MLPSGAAGRRFINELNRIVNLWTNKSPLKYVETKTIHAMPDLLMHMQITHLKDFEYKWRKERSLNA